MTVYPSARVRTWFRDLAASLGMTRCAIDRAWSLADRAELFLAYTAENGWHSLIYHPDRGSELFASPVRAALSPYGSQ